VLIPGNLQRVGRVSDPVKHRKLRRMVSAYVDGEIESAQAQQVSEHLAQCWECRAAAQLLRVMKESLRRLGRRSAPEIKDPEASRARASRSGRQ